MRSIVRGVVMVCLCLGAAARAAEVTAGALQVTWEGHRLTRLALAGEVLEGVRGEVGLLDPRRREPAAADAFRLDCDLRSRDGALWLEGVVTASGTADAVVDLVLRFEGVSLPTGDGVTDMMLAAKLLNKQPICPLRVLSSDRDLLAMAMPAEAPYVYDFRHLPAERAVTMRLPLGFSNQAPEAFRMRAPFAIVLYATDPAWHYRSALAEYYRLFPERFRSVEKRHGGWFFANETRNIPNPQHYAYHEGQGSLQDDHDRDMGMFPYNETGSQTIQLPGPGLPKGYEDAMHQMAALEALPSPAAWKLNGGEIDTAIARQGRHAYRASADGPRLTRHAQQIVRPAKASPEALQVSAWSRAEGVASHSGNTHDYAIYVDCLLADGSYQFGQCATFKAGTHDWERAEHTITPRAPVVELRVYAMFRNHTGTAWFDDVSIRTGTGEELLENGDFETLGRRDDIQFVRDNALTDPAGQYRVMITDNWGSDVRPTTPLSLLRFICNVDPDLRLPDDRLTPARRGTAFFDALFAASPDLDGAYIDGAGAWTCWYMSHRPDHFACISHPMSYDPGTFVVGQHGRLQSFKWLRFIQDRYRAQGRTILGNMGPTLDAWTSYTALDIVGIESAIFRDRALMGYHRFGSAQKPCLPMNFINLHGLDDRATAEEYVLASAQWGHMPSTGRMVREGYASYGDVCHTFYPALIEMSQAGWEPVPLVEGVAAERFGGPRSAGLTPPGSDHPIVAGAVYLTVRAPRAGRQATLRLLPALLAGMADPVVLDAVQLCPVPSRPTAAGLEVPLVDGSEALTILRVSDRAAAHRWYAERATRHCEHAAIVRGRSENTERLRSLATSLRGLTPAAFEAVGPLLGRLRQEQSLVAAEAESLERLSQLTELRDAERTLAEWRLFATGASLERRGQAVGPVSAELAVTLALNPGGSQARLLGSWAVPERTVLRLSTPDLPAHGLTTDALRLRRELPGCTQVRTAIEVPMPGADPVTVLRVEHVHFTPVVAMRVARRDDTAAAAVVYTVTVERLHEPTTLVVKAAGPLPVEPPEVRLGPADATAEFRVAAPPGRTTVADLEFTVWTEQGRRLDAGTAEFRHLPPPPEGDMALAEKGATASADSSYSGYSPDVTIDGVWETSALHWTKRAWASQDHAGEEGHWLEIRFPEARTLSELWIYWAVDNQPVYSSVHYEVQFWTGTAWQTVLAVRDNPRSTVSQHTWPPTSTDRVRLWQPKGGGPAVRPNIFWISEVCLFNRGTLN